MADFFNKNDKKKDKEPNPFRRAIFIVAVIFILLIAILILGHNIVNKSGSKTSFGFFSNTKKVLHMDKNETTTKLEVKTINKSTYNEDDLVLKTVNVGQGQCLIMSCKGENAMYDGGEYSFRMDKEIVNERNKIWDDYSYFKYVFLSHYDSDHAGGLVDVIYNKKIGKFIKPRYRAYTKTYTNINRALKYKKVKNVKAKAKKIYKLGDAKIKILKAEKKSYDENDNSIVIKVTHGNVSYMITGDLTNYGEYQLTKYKSTKKQLPSSVLVVGHHGSAGSSCNDFIHNVSPLYSIISVGKDNKYGHPSNSTLTVLRSYKSKILRTDELGTITIWDNGGKLFVQKGENNG